MCVNVYPADRMARTQINNIRAVRGDVTSDTEMEENLMFFTFTLCSTCLLSVEKLQLEKNLNQSSEKTQKQRKPVQQTR